MMINFSDIKLLPLLSFGQQYRNFKNLNHPQAKDADKILKQANINIHNKNVASLVHPVIHQENNNIMIQYLFAGILHDRAIFHLEYNPCKHNNKQSLYLRELFIHKDYRNKGVGTYVVNMVKNVICEDFYYLIIEANNNSDEFWKKLGFEYTNSSKSEKQMFLKLTT